MTLQLGSAPQIDNKAMVRSESIDSDNVGIPLSTSTPPPSPCPSSSCSSPNLKSFCFVKNSVASKAGPFLPELNPAARVVADCGDCKAACEWQATASATQYDVDMWLMVAHGYYLAAEDDLVAHDLPFCPRCLWRASLSAALSRGQGRQRSSRAVNVSATPMALPLLVVALIALCSLTEASMLRARTPGGTTYLQTAGDGGSYPGGVVPNTGSVVECTMVNNFQIGTAIDDLTPITPMAVGDVARVTVAMRANTLQTDTNAQVGIGYVVRHISGAATGICVAEGGVTIHIACVTILAWVPMSATLPTSFEYHGSFPVRQIVPSIFVYLDLAVCAFRSSPSLSTTFNPDTIGIGAVLVPALTSTSTITSFLGATTLPLSVKIDAISTSLPDAEKIPVRLTSVATVASPINVRLEDISVSLADAQQVPIRLVTSSILVPVSLDNVSPTLQNVPTNLRAIQTTTLTAPELPIKINSVAPGLPLTNLVPVNAVGGAVSANVNVLSMPSRKSGAVFLGTPSLYEWDESLSYTAEEALHDANTTRRRKDEADAHNQQMHALNGNSSAAAAAAAASSPSRDSDFELIDHEESKHETKPQKRVVGFTTKELNIMRSDMDARLVDAFEGVQQLISSRGAAVKLDDTSATRCDKAVATTTRETKDVLTPDKLWKRISDMRLGLTRWWVLYALGESGSLGEEVGNCVDVKTDELKFFGEQGERRADRQKSSNRPVKNEAAAAARTAVDKTPDQKASQEEAARVRVMAKFAGVVELVAWIAHKRPDRRLVARMVEYLPRQEKLTVESVVAHDVLDLYMTRARADVWCDRLLALDVSTCDLSALEGYKKSLSELTVRTGQKPGLREGVEPNPGPGVAATMTDVTESKATQKLTEDSSQGGSILAVEELTRLSGVADYSSSQSANRAVNDLLSVLLVSSTNAASSATLMPPEIGLFPRLMRSALSPALLVNAVFRCAWTFVASIAQPCPELTMSDNFFKLWESVRSGTQLRPGSIVPGGFRSDDFLALGVVASRAVTSGGSMVTPFLKLRNLVNVLAYNANVKQIATNSGLVSQLDNTSVGLSSASTATSFSVNTSAVLNQFGEALGGNNAVFPFGAGYANSGKGVLVVAQDLSSFKTGDRANVLAFPGEILASGDAGTPSENFAIAVMAFAPGPFNMAAYSQTSSDTAGLNLGLQPGIPIANLIHVNGESRINILLPMMNASRVPVNEPEARSNLLLRPTFGPNITPSNASAFQPLDVSWEGKTFEIPLCDFLNSWYGVSLAGVTQVGISPVSVQRVALTLAKMTGQWSDYHMACEMSDVLSNRYPRLITAASGNSPITPNSTDGAATTHFCGGVADFVTADYPLDEPSDPAFVVPSTNNLWFTSIMIRAMEARAVGQPYEEKTDGLYPNQAQLTKYTTRLYAAAQHTMFRMLGWPISLYNDALVSSEMTYIRSVIRQLWARLVSGRLMAPLAPTLERILVSITGKSARRDAAGCSLFHYVNAPTAYATARRGATTQVVDQIVPSLLPDPWYHATVRSVPMALQAWPTTGRGVFGVASGSKESVRKNIGGTIVSIPLTMHRQQSTVGFDSTAIMSDYEVYNAKIAWQIPNAQLIDSNATIISAGRYPDAGFVVSYRHPRGADPTWPNTVANFAYPYGCSAWMPSIDNTGLSVYVGNSNVGTIQTMIQAIDGRVPLRLPSLEWAGKTLVPLVSSPGDMQKCEGLVFLNESASTAAGSGGGKEEARAATVAVVQAATAAPDRS